MNSVHCMYCGHSIELDSTYDFYEGPLCCLVCKNTMAVRFEQGKLIAMERSPEVDEATAPSITIFTDSV